MDPSLTARINRRSGAVRIGSDVSVADLPPAHSCCARSHNGRVARERRTGRGIFVAAIFIFKPARVCTSDDYEGFIDATKRDSGVSGNKEILRAPIVLRSNIAYIWRRKTKRLRLVFASNADGQATREHCLIWLESP